MYNSLSSRHFSPEQKLLLLLIRPRQSGEVISEAKKLFCNGSRAINSGELFSLAVQNGVASILYRNSQDLDFIPQDLKERLKNTYCRILLNNTKHLQETLKISNALKENGIESIILKGSLASDMLFGDPGLYPTGDIDLFVRTQDVGQTTDILLNLDYKIIDRTKLLEQSDYAGYENGSYFIDLHWNLVEPYFNVPNDFWWMEAGKKINDNVQLMCLSGERYLLFSICHLFSHGFTTLKFFSLIDAIITVYKPGIDWKKMIYYSNEYGLRRVICFTLRLLHEMLGAEVPEQFRDMKLCGYKICRKFVVDGLFKRSPLLFVRIAVYLLLLAGPSALVKVTLRAISPNPAKLRSRYGLSEHSKLVYLYYALNPFLILFKRT